LRLSASSIERLSRPASILAASYYFLLTSSVLLTMPANDYDLIAPLLLRLRSE